MAHGYDTLWEQGALGLGLRALRGVRRCWLRRAGRGWRLGVCGPYGVGGTWPHQPEAHIISPADVVALPAFSFLQRCSTQSAASEKLALENGVMWRSRMRQHTAIHGAMVNDASMNATWQEASAAMSTCTATARGQEKENTDMGGTWPRPHSQQPGLAAGQNSPMLVTWEIRSTPPILT